MWKELFKHTDLLNVPILVMMFFFSVFAVVLFVALSRRRVDHYRTMAHLPLDDDPPPGARDAKERA